MSTNAASRGKILGSIRQSLASARHIPPSPQVTLPAPTQPGGDLAEQFAAELKALSGTYVAMLAADVPAWLTNLLGERDIHKILSWRQADLPVPGLLDALRAAGVQVLEPALPHDEPGRSAALAEAETVTFGVTGADAGFADTASLALTAGPGRPRLASLSVRTHLALLDSRRLYASWAAWLAAEGSGASERLAGASNLTLITGPSRTADIEMTLTVGVHGPGELIVVLVSAAP